MPTFCEVDSPHPKPRVHAGAKSKVSGPLRGDEPGRYIPQPKMYEYKAPHVLWEHKWLALAFTLIALGCGLYVYFSPHKERRYDPDVYVEPLTQPTVQPTSQPDGGRSP